MRHPPRPAAITILALAALGAMALSLLRFDTRSAHGAPATDELLRIESDITYEVRPDTGPVRVVWEVDLQNNDPSTQAGSFGTVYFYESVSLPILGGATAVQATTPSGAPLFVSVDDSEFGTLDIATISFDRELYFGEQYAFTLSYDLVGARSEALLVSEAYVYVPAIVVGDAASVHVRTPQDPAWSVTVEPLDCAPAAAGSFSCAGSEETQIAALVEVTRPGALQSIEASVALANGDIDVTIAFYPGEEAWGEHLREVASAALPALEELFGFSYEGARSLLIAERGRQEIAGYEGTFGCLEEECVIGISPVADDATALHELAHLWTQSFDQRWIAEGLAEFMSQRAADRLGTLANTRPDIVPRTVDLQLHEWERSHYLIGAEEDDLVREDTGYYESRRFFELLEETAGLGAIQAANAAAAELTDIDSQTYLDLLEDASGARLDALFLDRIFPASFAGVLETRRDVRVLHGEVAAALQAADFELPDRVAWLIGDWQFDSAERLLNDASAALDAYTSAQEAVSEPRSLWTRIGLLGEDPDRALSDAEASLRDAEYDRARQRATAAQAMLDSAGDDARLRVLVGSGVIVLIVVAVGGLWFVRRA